MRDNQDKSDLFSPGDEWENLLLSFEQPKMHQDSDSGDSLVSEQQLDALRSVLSTLCLLRAILSQLIVPWANPVLLAAIRSMLTQLDALQEDITQLDSSWVILPPLTTLLPIQAQLDYLQANLAQLTIPWANPQQLTALSAIQSVLDLFRADLLQAEEPCPDSPQPDAEQAHPAQFNLAEVHPPEAYLAETPPPQASGSQRSLLQRTLLQRSLLQPKKSKRAKQEPTLLQASEPLVPLEYAEDTEFNAQCRKDAKLHEVRRKIKATNKKLKKAKESEDSQKIQLYKKKEANLKKTIPSRKNAAKQKLVKDMSRVWMEEIHPIIRNLTTVRNRVAAQLEISGESQADATSLEQRVWEALREYENEAFVKAFVQIFIATGSLDWDAILHWLRSRYVDGRYHRVDGEQNGDDDDDDDVDVDDVDDGDDDDDDEDEDEDDSDENMAAGSSSAST
mmetsp:Transcript_7847/g.13889  ORF Transcript_7847/g.13889 Transcript_7847/m.13889 type:complete len:450 (-) Transcript_7847:184-1533(-)